MGPSEVYHPPEREKEDVTVYRPPPVSVTTYAPSIWCTGSYTIHGSYGGCPYYYGYYPRIVYFGYHGLHRRHQPLTIFIRHRWKRQKCLPGIGNRERDRDRAPRDRRRRPNRTRERDRSVRPIRFRVERNVQRPNPTRGSSVRRGSGGGSRGGVPPDRPVPRPRRGVRGSGRRAGPLTGGQHLRSGGPRGAGRGPARAGRGTRTPR